MGILANVGAGLRTVAITFLHNGWCGPVGLSVFSNGASVS